MRKYMKINNRTSVKQCVLTLTLSLVLMATFFFGDTGVNFASAAEPPASGNYYTADYETKADTLAAGKLLNEEIQGEGMTLLKNEDSALPLSNGAKISLFGKSSANLLTGGSGSGNGSGGESVSIQQALRKAGFELNPTLVNFYSDNSASGSGRGTAPTNGNVSSGYNTGETPVSSYTPTIEGTYGDYNDAALVVFSRIGGEGFDLPRTMMWNGSSYGTWGDNEKVPGARSKDDHYLQLDQNEADLLKYLGGKFGKVIVMLNTGSQFECGFLDDPTHYGYHANIKAALWIGYPGGTGLNALGKLLKGEINPSGKTVDTYARDFKQDPTWVNFGNNLTPFGNQYSNLPGSGGNGGGGYRNNYVYYKEGIYVGYRYYETRGMSDEEWYDKAVVYPFGHGLSYTTFTQTVLTKTPAASSNITDNDTITVTVEVTNTGTVAGKDIVQLYYTAPYIAGEIEKSHVVLGDFAKTKLLAPNEKQTLTLTMKVREMASYDFDDANKNSFKGYELDAGQYSVKIMRNSHEVIDSVDYNIETGIKCLLDDKTKNEVTNQFDNVSSKIDVYLSRNNWTDTMPTMNLKIAASADIVSGVAQWLDNKPSDVDKPYYSDTAPTLGNDTGDVQLSDLHGLEYDDPMWDTYLDQFSANTLRALATNGNYSSGVDVAGLGITKVVNADGPAGWVNWSYGTGGSSYVFYGSETILASTYNKELAYEKGKMMGNEALFGNGTPYSKFPGYYAPAINIHRSPFSGRNFEYYSEDGVLSGIMASELVKGAKEKGLFCYVKHFGVNDQETNRCGLMTWASEQSMREIYLKGFEITVKEGGTTAIMSALNRIGTTWAGGSYELLTTILRDEWGFRGTVVTDSFLPGLSQADQMVRAGGDLSLGRTSIGYEPNSATTLTVLRKTAHNLCYTHANSMAINTGTMVKPPVMSEYKGGLLDAGIMEIAYNTNLATVTIDEEALGEVYDPNLMEYTVISGILPSGLTLSTKGILSGTPTEEINNCVFTVQAKYKSYTKQAIFTISVVDPNGSILYQTGEPLSIATIGTAYTGSVATAHIFKPDATAGDIAGFPPITYALKNGSFLPEGLSLSVDGTLNGTPTKECQSYEFTVVASALGYKDKELTLSITVYNALTFETKTLAQAKFGISYVDRVALATSVKEVTYSLKDGSTLPKGLTLTTDGYVVGTPTLTVTNHEFTVIAKADYSVMQESVYKITVGIAFNDTTLTDGKVGDSYDATIDMAQGAASITYALKEGSVLPDGLSLSADGTITGTPTKAGVYTLTFTANADGLVGDEITATLYIAQGETSGGRGSCSGTVATSGFMLVGLSVTLCALFLLRKKRTE